jgi:two-component system, cell cycle sensor histidine kinase and response regulator CckA
LDFSRNNPNPVWTDDSETSHFLEMNPAVSKKQNRAPGGNETVLLIEDDHSIRYLMAHTLESCGYRVVQAEDGLSGLALGKEMLSSIDAVISDAIMPRMSGQEVVLHLRDMRPALKAMLVSGHIEADVIELAGDTRTIFLCKPVPPETLRKELRRLLDGADSALQDEKHTDQA